MELIFALCVGILTSCGVYLTLRGSTFSVVVGLTLLSYAINLFLFAVILAMRARADLGNDHVDGNPPDAEQSAPQKEAS